MCGRFLDLLKSLDNIQELCFGHTPQPQELFDRLPDYCDIQVLSLVNAPADFDFLFRLKGLWFCFGLKNTNFDIDYSMQFEINIGLRKYKTVSDLNEAI